MHSEIACLVARRSDHATGSETADHDGHATQRSIAQALDLHVEGVHVDVEESLGKRNGHDLTTDDRCSRANRSGRE